MSGDRECANMHPTWGREMAAGGGSVPSTLSSSVVVCCGISLVKKPNTSRVVWDYFGLKANQNGTLVLSETH